MRRRAGGRLAALIVGTVGLIGCAAIVVLLTYRHNVRVDFTSERRYTLSTHARKILRELNENVRITAFVRSADPRTPFFKDLLWRVAAATPRVTYEFVDLNRSPALAARYGVDRYGALVVEGRERRRDVSNPTEGLLMGAILGVTRERQRVVYFVTGHGEHSPDSADRKTGYSTVKRLLEEELFQVRSLPLIGPGGIPGDATLLVLAGPRKDLLPDEMAGLEAYLARGGNLLLMLDPESPADLARLAARYGITPLDKVVVDPERRLAAGEGVTLLVSGLTLSFLVSGTLEAPPVFSYARPLAIESNAPASPIAFLQTGPASYATEAGDASRRDPETGRGPLTVGAAVTFTVESGAAGRLIVYGDADFATNGIIDYLGNKDLVVNSANWLTREETLIAARAQQKELGREQFFVTEAQGAMAFWLAAVLQPALFLIAGAIVFLRNRLA